MSFDSSLGLTPGFGTRTDPTTGETEPIGNGSGTFEFWPHGVPLPLKHFRLITDVDGEIYSDNKFVGKFPFGALTLVAAPGNLPHPPPVGTEGGRLQFKPNDEKLSVISPPPGLPVLKVVGIHGRLPMARRTTVKTGNFVHSILGYFLWNSNDEDFFGAGELNQEYFDMSVTDPFHPIAPGGQLYAEKGHILRVAVSTRITTLSPPLPGSCTLRFNMGTVIDTPDKPQSFHRQPPFYLPSNPGEAWRVRDQIAGITTSQGTTGFSGVIEPWPDNKWLLVQEGPLVSPVLQVACHDVFPDDTEFEYGAYPR